MANMYFIALVAPKEINEDVLKWKQLMKERFGCLVALRSPAHITLVPPFWMDPGLERKLEEAIDNFAREQTPFEISLHNFAAFKPRVIYVDVPSAKPLEILHNKLFRFLFDFNSFPLEKEERPFHPHVTLATRDLHKKSFHEAWEIFKEKSYEASWSVNNISLLRHNQKNWDVTFTSQFPN